MEDFFYFSLSANSLKWWIIFFAYIRLLVWIFSDVGIDIQTRRVSSDAITEAVKFPSLYIASKRHAISCTNYV